MRCRGAAFVDSPSRVSARAPSWLAGVAACALSGAHAASVDSGTLNAEPARLAPQSVLLDLAAAGTRLVAVGDRGIVVLSDNHKQT